MSVQIIAGDNVACLYCTTNDWAFGPVFQGPMAQEQAECFCDWFTDGEAIKAHGQTVRSGGRDPREYSMCELERLHSIWRERCTDDGGELLYACLPDGGTDWMWRGSQVPA